MEIIVIFLIISIVVGVIKGSNQTKLEKLYKESLQKLSKAPSNTKSPNINPELPINTKSAEGKPGCIILLLIFLAPVGLIYMWLHKGWSLRTKQIITAIMIIIAISCEISNQNDRKNKVNIPQQVILDDFGIPKGFTPKYRVDSDEDCHVSNAACRNVTVWVPKGLSKVDLDLQLRHITESAFNKYHAVRGIGFALAEGTDENGAFSAGRIQWGNQENVGSDDSNANSKTTASTIKIDYDDTYFKPATPSAPNVSKIPEDIRKKINFEESNNEENADYESIIEFPENLDLYGARKNNLILKFNKALCNKFHITDDQLSTISIEGSEKHWPTQKSIAGTEKAQEHLSKIGSNGFLRVEPEDHGTTLSLQALNSTAQNTEIIIKTGVKVKLLYIDADTSIVQVISGSYKGSKIRLSPKYLYIM
jgi:hypothetical protein